MISETGNGGETDNDTDHFEGAGGQETRSDRARLFDPFGRCGVYRTTKKKVKMTVVKRAVLQCSICQKVGFGVAGYTAEGLTLKGGFEGWTSVEFWPICSACTKRKETGIWPEKLTPDQLKIMELERRLLQLELATECLAAYADPNGWAKVPKYSQIYNPIKKRQKPQYIIDRESKK